MLDLLKFRVGEMLARVRTFADRFSLHQEQPVFRSRTNDVAAGYLNLERIGILRHGKGSGLDESVGIEALNPEHGRRLLLLN